MLGPQTNCLYAPSLSSFPSRTNSLLSVDGPAVVFEVCVGKDELTQNRRGTIREESMLIGGVGVGWVLGTEVYL